MPDLTDGTKSVALLTLALVVLKLSGMLSWSWFWVFSPVLIWPILASVILAIAFIKAGKDRADTEPMLRCKDCIYGEEAEVNEKGFTICPASGMEITDDDFCSYGERKEI